MTIDADSSYSRLTTTDLARSYKTPPKPTGPQKALEWSLFAVFGFTLALAGVALYATNRPEHRMVPNRVSAGIASDRVNILLIGSSLRPRAGGDSEIRVESLMLLSLQPSTGRAALMSIPVDLWVRVGRYGQRPLQAAHALGDAAGYPGAGAGLTVDTVENIIAEPVHAYARFSIGDVQRLVDALGGVDVEVRRGVYEYRSKFRFRPGPEHLNGTRAIRYAYSGYIAGLAASNRFAREQRQQDVILAALGKAMDTRDDVDSLEPVFGSVTATNLTRDDADLLVGALRRGDDIRRIDFAPYLDSFDVASVAYRGEVVRPRSGDFGALQKIADAALDAGVARVH
jgi:LCP family protein required for cell wall assembly